jgi:hypothetical protein
MNCNLSILLGSWYYILPLDKGSFSSPSLTNSFLSTPKCSLYQGCKLNGIVEKTASGIRLCLWNMRQGKSFLEIELCNSPQVTEKHLSVDPFIFRSARIQTEKR